MARHKVLLEANQQLVTKTIEQISALAVKDGVTLWESVTTHLHHLYKEMLEKYLYLDCYFPVSKLAQGYASHILYCNNDEANPLSILLFVFGPGNRTLIHDHKAECLTIVLSDQIKEQHYQQIAEESSWVKKIAKGSNIRYQGDVQYDSLTDSKIIHRLKHTKHSVSDYAITLHAYHCLPTQIEENIVKSNSVYNYFQEVTQIEMPKTRSDSYQNFVEESRAKATFCVIL